MAKQVGKVLFTGSRFGGTGYISQEGGTYFRRRPYFPTRKLRFGAAFARSRAAAAVFGERAALAALFWRRTPKRLRLLMGEHGYAAFMQKAVLGGFDGKHYMGGFGIGEALHGSLAEVELEGERDWFGQRRVWDVAGWRNERLVAVRVAHLRGMGQEAGGKDSVSSSVRAEREFLPVGGHHVTGGTGGARSRQRREVIATRAGKGKRLADRREEELERWDKVARKKGFAGRREWFGAMRTQLLGDGEMDPIASDRDRSGLVVRVHVAMVGAVAVKGYVGKWMRLRDLVRIRVPRHLEGLLVLGLEYGRRSVKASVREEGLVVPMACLNRVWCCGFHVLEGQGKGSVSLSASEEKVFGGRFGAQKGSVRLSVSEEVQVVDRRFGAQKGSVSLRVSEEVQVVDRPFRTQKISVSVRASEEISLDLGP